MMIMAEPIFEITKSITFEAAHRLPQKDAAHEYGRIHGHSFLLEVTLKGERQKGAPWVADFADLARALADIKAILDHQMLNEIEGLEKPTLEALAMWVGDKLMDEFNSLSRVTIARPSLSESCTLRFDQSL